MVIALALSVVFLISYGYHHAVIKQGLATLSVEPMREYWSV